MPTAAVVSLPKKGAEDACRDHGANDQAREGYPSPACTGPRAGPRVAVDGGKALGPPGRSWRVTRGRFAAGHASGGRGGRQAVGGGECRATQVARRRVSLGRLHGHSPRDDGLERVERLPRDPGHPRLGDRRTWGHRVREGRFAWGGSWERDMPGEHPVKRASKRVDIRARVDGRARDLLGRRVVDRAYERPRVRDTCL